MYEYKYMARPRGLRRPQVALQPIKLLRPQAPKGVAWMLLRPARIPVIRIELREVTAGVVEAVDASFVRGQVGTLRVGTVHRMHKFGSKYGFGTLLPLLVQLRAIVEHVDQRVMIPDSGIDGNLVPKRPINALPGAQLCAEVVFARRISTDEIAGKDQQMRS